MSVLSQPPVPAAMPARIGTQGGSSRLFALDLLRGLAASLVLFAHLPIDGPSIAPVDLLRRIGGCGVDLFFVLSGYLISGLLYKEYDRTGGLRLGRFWLRRGLKIWPSYFAAYGLVVVLQSVSALAQGELDRVAQTWLRALPNLVFIQNLMVRYQWTHSWTIAIEEQFYLILPLLLLLLITRRGARSEGEPARVMATVVPAGLLLCLGLLVLRVLAARNGLSERHLYYWTPFRADALCFGVVLGFLGHYRMPAVRRWTRGLEPVMVLLAVAVPIWVWHSSGLFRLSVGLTLMYGAFGGVVLLAARSPGAGREGPAVVAWPARFLAFVGTYSYTIYLFHSILEWFLQQFQKRLLALDDRVMVVIFPSLSIAGGILLSHLVERPALRLRDRLCPSSSRTPAQGKAAIAAGAVPEIA